MELFVINTPPCKYDGGATFGIVPKSIWSKEIASDENNMVTSAMRCLLIIEGERKVLIDTGIGNKLNEKKKQHFSFSETHSLTVLLKERNILPEQITDVVLTHLHFDHVGGATVFDSNQKAIPLFPNAKHWVSFQQWENALHPNSREKASYYFENYMPLYENNLIEFIENDTQITSYLHLLLFSGHTKGQIVPFIHFNKKVLVFMGDFIPMVHHIPIPYIASFDIAPLIAMQEKERFLEDALVNKYTLFFEHDPDNECASIEATPKGIGVKEIFSLAQFCES